MTERIKQEENIEQKKTESIPEKLSIAQVDNLLTERIEIYSSLNSFYKTDVFKNVDFENKIKLRGVGVENEKFDEIAYGKATLGKKFLNFTTFGLAKKDIGLIKSKERGLLNKNIFNKEIAGKEIEVRENKEERSDIEKLIGNFHKELSPEDLEKRQIVKRFEFADGKIIKTVEASRTEQGMIDAARKLRDEKIKEVDNFGSNLVKLKEQFEKHTNEKNKIKNLKHVRDEAKEDLRKKMTEEEENLRSNIKDREEELKNKLDIFRKPLEERHEQTNELLNRVSLVFESAKNLENDFKKKVSEIDDEIKLIEKSGILSESKKGIINELQLNKEESVRILNTTVELKTNIEARLKVLTANKKELADELSKINKIGKTKREIEEEKTEKTKENTSKPTGEDVKKETTEKGKGLDFAEDWSFMEGQKIGKEEKEPEKSAKSDQTKQETEAISRSLREVEEENILYDLTDEQDKAGINEIIEGYLTKKAPQKKKDKGFLAGFIKNVFGSLFELKKTSLPINKKSVLKETDKVYKKSQKKESKAKFNQ